MSLDMCAKVYPTNDWYAIFIEVDEQGRGNAVRKRLIAWVEVIKIVKSGIGTDTEVKNLVGMYSDFINGPTVIIDDPWFVYYRHVSDLSCITVDFINNRIKKVRSNNVSNA